MNESNEIERKSNQDDSTRASGEVSASADPQQPPQRHCPCTIVAEGAEEELLLGARVVPLVCVCVVPRSVSRNPTESDQRNKGGSMSGGGTFAETSPLPLTSVEEMLPFHEELPSWYC